MNEKKTTRTPSTSRYTGDPRTGWNLPPANSPKYSAYLLGIKIACGLEMLVALAHEEQRRLQKQLDGQGENTASGNEAAWRAFLGRLEANGYFGELLEGSNERERLLGRAREFYEEHVAEEAAGRRPEATGLLGIYRDIQSNDMEMEGEW